MFPLLLHLIVICLSLFCSVFIFTDTFSSFSLHLSAFCIGKLYFFSLNVAPFHNSFIMSPIICLCYRLFFSSLPLSSLPVLLLMDKSLHRLCLAITKHYGFYLHFLCIFCTTSIDYDFQSPAFCLAKALCTVSYNLTV